MDMRKFKNTIFIGFVALLPLVTCCEDKETKGSPVTAAENLAKEWNLMGTWESECAGSDLFQAHRKKKFGFEGAIFNLVTEFYVGADKCEGTPSITLDYEGTFKLRNINDDV